MIDPDQELLERSDEEVHPSAPQHGRYALRRHFRAAAAALRGPDDPVRAAEPQGLGGAAGEGARQGGWEREEGERHARRDESDKRKRVFGGVCVFPSLAFLVPSLVLSFVSRRMDTQQ